jgi:hypothetical protein
MIISQQDAISLLKVPIFWYALSRNAPKNNQYQYHYSYRIHTSLITKIVNTRKSKDHACDLYVGTVFYLGTKNVYKVKRDPVTEALQFKVRNVVKGYMQEQGIDYTEAFAGVAADASIGCLLALSLYEEKKNNTDWSVEAIDVEAAFLEGEMDHELYIDLPNMYKEYCVKRGIELEKNDVIRGANFLMKNNGIGSRTKHIDIRMRFLNDMVENGELEMDHCPGKFITPDAITKTNRRRCTGFMRIRCTTGIYCHQPTIDRTGRM